MFHKLEILICTKLLIEIQLKTLTQIFRVFYRKSLQGFRFFLEKLPNSQIFQTYKIP